ncbi:MAG: hypothetical protein WD250_13115 [Egibacteraceae bacterium]
MSLSLALTAIGLATAVAIATLLWLTLDASDQRRQAAERAEARTTAAVQCVARCCSCTLTSAIQTLSSACAAPRSPRECASAWRPRDDQAVACCSHAPMAGYEGATHGGHREPAAAEPPEGGD